MIIHWTKYQRCFAFAGKLCDRLIFHRWKGITLTAVELKGGRRFNFRESWRQIQNGLTVAENMAQGNRVRDYFPVLLYSGHMGTGELKLLRTSRVVFKGKKKLIEKKACSSPLLDITGASASRRR